MNRILRHRTDVYCIHKCPRGFGCETRACSRGVPGVHRRHVGSQFPQRHGKTRPFDIFPRSMIPGTSKDLYSVGRYSTRADGDGTKTYLRSEVSDIVLIGTAHVSAKSSQEVQQTIRRVKPQTVFVELCPTRAQRMLMNESFASNKQTDIEFLKDALGSLLSPGAQIQQEMLHIALRGLYRVLGSIGMDPGSEFRVAMAEAKRIKAQIILGDRDIHDTMRRLGSRIQLQDVWKLCTTDVLQDVEFDSKQKDSWFGGGYQWSTQLERFEQQVEIMKNRKTARQLVDGLRRINPLLASALIDERDEILFERLKEQRGSVVGVVGLAHMDGIERLWQQSGGFLRRHE